MGAALALALSGCAVFQTGDSQARFDGNIYPAELVRDEADRARFLVAVEGVSQGLAGAREAGRFEATKYCIAQYGNSRVFWAVGPDSEAARIAVAGDTLTFQGECEGW